VTASSDPAAPARTSAPPRDRPVTAALLQWRYECRAELGVLALSGRLDAKAVSRLAGAIGWTLFRGRGPLILDLGAVTSWTSLGQAGVVEAAVRLAAGGRRLEIASAPAGGDSVIAGNRMIEIRVHDDLAAALGAHGAAPDAVEECREWRSSDWPEATGRRGMAH
jgi:hypothetical protein